MRIARLRHRVALRYPTNAQDSQGDAVPAWTTLPKVWAEVKTLSGTERERADLATALPETFHRVTIRAPFSPLPRATWQVQWGDRLFEVLAVAEPDNRQRVLVLDCQEVVVTA